RPEKDRGEQGSSKKEPASSRSRRGQSRHRGILGVWSRSIRVEASACGENTGMWIKLPCPPESSEGRLRVTGLRLDPREDEPGPPVGALLLGRLARRRGRLVELPLALQHQRLLEARRRRVRLDLGRGL